MRCVKAACPACLEVGVKAYVRLPTCVISGKEMTGSRGKSEPSDCCPRTGRRVVLSGLSTAEVCEACGEDFAIGLRDETSSLNREKS